MRRAIAITVLFFQALAAFSLEIDAEARFGSLAFPWSQDEATAGTGPFPADNWSYGLALGFDESLSESLRIDARYETDQILRHIVSATIVYETGFAKLGLGPFLGAFGSFESPIKSGIATTVEVGWPGLAFAGFESASSVGAGLVAKGDLLLERSRLYAGWYVPNAICTVSVESKKFNLMLAADERSADAWSRYAFSVDVFDKSAPYRVLTRLAYTTLSKTWDSGTALTETLGALSLGATLTFNLNPNLDLVGGFDAAVYAFGLDSLAGRSPAADSMLFDARLGVRIGLGSDARPARPSEPSFEELAPEGEGAMGEPGPQPAPDSLPAEALGQ